MAALGRILQILGWLWLAVGFFGPLVNLPDVSWFPGIILVFVSRILRGQGARREKQEEAEETLTPNVARPPDPPRAQRRPAPVPPKPAPVVVEPSRAEVEQRLLETLGERVDSVDEPDVEELLKQVDQMDRPKSSAEMIAEAHQRWNKRP